MSSIVEWASPRVGLAGRAVLAGGTIASLLIGFPLAATAQPRNAGTAPILLHVDCSAAGAGDGSLAKPYATIKQLPETLAPGTTVAFRRGTHCNGTLAPKGSGTADAPITFTAYGTGELPVINANSTATDPRSTIQLENQSHFVIENLKLTGGWFSNLRVRAQGNAQLAGFTVRHIISTENSWVGRFNEWVTGAGGIVIEPCSTTASISDVVVDGVESSGAHITGLQLGHHPHAAYDPANDGHAGMTTPGCSMGLPKGSPSPKTGIQNAVVRNSRLHDNDASGLQVFGATNVLISRNELYRNGSGSGSKPANPSGMNGEGAWWDSTDRVTAEWNNAWGNREGYSGNDGAGLDADRNTTRTIIQNNYLHGNANYGASVIVGAGDSDAIIRWNVMADNGVRYPDAPDIMVSRPYPSGHVTALKVHNNTLMRQRSAAGIRLQAPFAPKAQAEIFNNIISRPVASPILSTTTADARVFTNSDDAAEAPSYVYAGVTYRSLAAFQQATQQGVGNLTVNPIILGWDYSGNPWPKGDTFRLAKGSPVIGMGTPLATKELDFWGREVPAGAAVAMGADSAG